MNRVVKAVRSSAALPEPNDPLPHSNRNERRAWFAQIRFQ